MDKPNQYDIEVFDRITYPGLTAEAPKIQTLIDNLTKKMAVYVYKNLKTAAWIAFMGGTGTGKSTLFNTLCGGVLSATGVERPKTEGPVAFAHRDTPVEEGFPFRSIHIERHSFEDDLSTPTSGTFGHLLILEHHRKDWSHLILVDTPDLDSVEAGNRQISKDLYLLSDAVVFVTSQEKYADEVPTQFLKTVVSDENPYYLLLNKVKDRIENADLLKTFQNQEIQLRPDRLWPIFYVPSNVLEGVSEQSGFCEFTEKLLLELTPAHIDHRLKLRQ